MHGRGIGAATVTAGDAARLLVAILGSMTLADSVDVRFRVKGSGNLDDLERIPDAR